MLYEVIVSLPVTMKKKIIHFYSIEHLVENDPYYACDFIL